MKKYYKISHIRKALDAFEKEFPERKSISLDELEKISKNVRTPEIYNIEELIKLLTTYIAENRHLPNLLRRESEVCNILKTQKLTMHHWRKNGNITYIQGDTRTVWYDLKVLLTDLKKNKY